MPRSTNLGRAYDLDLDQISDDEEDAKAAYKKKVAKERQAKAASGEDPTSSSTLPTNPMDAEIEGTPFSVLMQQAVKMKSAQQETFRTMFDSWPKFYQNSLFTPPDLAAQRSSPFETLMALSVSKKNEGNAALLAQQYLSALNAYDVALSLFVWCYSTDPNWKSGGKGIRDDTLVMSSYVPASPEEALLVNKHIVTVLTNVAFANFNDRSYANAIAACDEALLMCGVKVGTSSSSASASAVRPSNPSRTSHMDWPSPPDVDGAELKFWQNRGAKVLYRRAMCLLEPASAGATEQERALKDLTLAEGLAAAADKGMPEASEQSLSISKRLARLKVEMKHQKNRDKKTFSGLFDRGELCLPGDEKGSSSSAAGSSSSEFMGGPSADSDITRRLAEAKELHSIYVRKGKDEEARLLQSQIDATEAARKSIEEKKKQQRSKGGVFGDDCDFRNPTAEMKAHALKEGIDLSDERVLSMLEELQRSKKEASAAGLSGPEAMAAADRKAREVYVAKTRRELSERVGEMPAKDLAKMLGEMGVGVKRGEEKDEKRLKELLIDALLEGKLPPERAAGASLFDETTWKGWTASKVVALFGVRADGKKKTFFDHFKFGLLFVVFTFVFRRVAGVLMALLGFGAAKGMEAAAGTPIAARNPYMRPLPVVEERTMSDEW